MRSKIHVTESKQCVGSAHGSDRSPRYGIQHILVCVDSSPSAAICIDYALSLATVFDSAVTFMYVMQHHDDRFGPHTTDVLGWEFFRQEAQARLERLENEAVQRSGRNIDIRLEQGNPGERIDALSRELGADLVVLGSHELSDDRSRGLGRTARHVLAVGHRSVLIARGRSVRPSFIPPKRILVPLDGSLRTESVLPTAESIARAHGAQLVLIHVVAEPLPTCVLATPEDLQLARELATRLEVRAIRYLETLNQHLEYDELLVDKQVARQTDKRQFLVDVMETEKIDLVVLSAQGCTCNIARPFGSVTTHLLSHSNVPLLVIRDPQMSEFRYDERASLMHGTYLPEYV